MYYFACYRIDGFYADALTAADPSLFTRPLCVHRDKVILDANRSALDRHVRRGMPLGEARSIVPEGVFRRWEEEPYRSGQHRWLTELCEFVDQVEPAEQHFAFADLSIHPDPVEMACVARNRLEGRLGLPVELGMGPAKWIARALCGLPPAELREIALRETMASPASAISDLPVYALPVSAQTCERLRFLGYATVGRVHALPLDQLVRQFGEEGHAVFQACRGGHVDLVNPTFPERSAAVSFTPEGGVADLESLGACLRVLADRLGEMLVAQDRFGKILEVRLELEDASIEKRKRTFVKPIEGVRAALFGLRTLLENPPEQPIVRFQARMHELEKARRIQRDLNGLTDRKERDRSAASAFLNLRKVLGDDCVQLGSEREEPRRVKVLRAWRDATGWR